MNAEEQKRKARLLPNGKPRWLRIYDNGGETIDRFTVIFTGNYTRKTGGQYWVIMMNERPFWPQGFCMHETFPYQRDAINGKRPPAVGQNCHLGKRITFDDLNADCRRAVMRDYCYLWDIN